MFYKEALDTVFDAIEPDFKVLFNITFDKYIRNIV